jgi:hypothetical protein
LAAQSVNRGRVIEFMNRAVTQILGHSPEQKVECGVASLVTAASAALLDAGEPIDEKVGCLTEGGDEGCCRCVASWPAHDRAQSDAYLCCPTSPPQRRGPSPALWGGPNSRHGSVGADRAKLTAGRDAAAVGAVHGV